jgi:hypothetical protein
MLTQLASKDWFKVLEEELLPLRERLAIAFQFLEDKALSSYLCISKPLGSVQLCAEPHSTQDTQLSPY